MNWLPIDENTPRGQDDEILVARFDEDGSKWYATAMWWVDTWAFFAASPRQTRVPILLAFEPTHWQPLIEPPE